MNNYLFLLSSLFIFFNISCTKDCVVGDGNLVPKVVTLSSFSKIKNQSSIDIKLTEGNERSASITGDSNIVELVRLEIDDETLKVDFDASCIQTSSSIVCSITLPNINSIENRGTGNITGTTRFLNPIIDNTGTGQVELRGQSVANITVENSGTGTVILYGLQAENASLENTGTGDCFVRVANSLDVRISGTGSVYYKGMPTITQDISGTGMLIEDN